MVKENKSLNKNIQRGYKNLGRHILTFAVRDYQAALKKLKENPNDCVAKRDKKEIENFVHGRLYAVITTIDPDKLLASLKE